MKCEAVRHTFINKQGNLKAAAWKMIAEKAVLGKFCKAVSLRCHTRHKRSRWLHGPDKHRLQLCSKAKKKKKEQKLNMKSP